MTPNRSPDDDVNEPAAGFRHIGDRQIHVGHVWTAVVAGFTGPTGEQFEREIVRSRGAVATVPVTYAPDDADRTRPLVTMIAQYRPAIDRAMVEIPAGMRDVDGEDDAENARRELAEEVGLAAGALELLTVIHPSVGMTDSTCAIFLATDCVPVPRRPQGAEEDHAVVLTVPLCDAVADVEAGRISDAKSVTGLLLAQRRLGR